MYDHPVRDGTTISRVPPATGLLTRAGAGVPTAGPRRAGAWMDHTARQGGSGRGRSSSRATGSNDPMVVLVDDREDDLARAQAEYYKIRKAVTAVLRYDFKSRFTSMEALASSLHIRCSVARLEVFFRLECPHMGEHRFILFEEDGRVLVRAIPSTSQHHHRPMGRGQDP